MLLQAVAERMNEPPAKKKQRSHWKKKPKTNKQDALQTISFATTEAATCTLPATASSTTTIHAAELQETPIITKATTETITELQPQAQIMTAADSTSSTQATSQLVDHTQVQDKAEHNIYVQLMEEASKWLVEKLAELERFLSATNMKRHKCLAANTKLLFTSWQGSS